MNLDAALKKLLYRLIFIANYQTRLIKRIQFHQHIPILSLHKISPEQNYFWPALHPYVFENLLKFLIKNFAIVTLHELNQKYTKPKLVLSFDDGYYDFIEHAMPILKKYNIKANLNIIPAQLKNEQPLWNIALYDFFNAASPVLIQQMQIPGLDSKNFDGTIKNKIRLGLQASRVLKKLTTQTRDVITTRLESDIYSQCEPYPKTRMIKLDEMPCVLSEHEVGVHSYAHNSMGNETMAYFIQDFNKCKEFFLMHHYPDMDIYAFPNGSYREEQIAYLKNNGVKHILLVENEYAQIQSPYYRFNIAAFNHYETIFQALGIKSKGIKYEQN
ncbi:MAG: polysaccharide deacetylase family protein [Gammaproteobacteria bacterium]|nr:polysaccharide deacetylase family protein [Gammaproteobacteria bacterium]